MKYCQGPKCHEYKTKDRIRGSKGDKHYETRRRSSFYYMNGNACSMICQNDWFKQFGNMALDVYTGGAVKFLSLYCAWLIGLRSPSKSLMK